MTPDSVDDSPAARYTPDGAYEARKAGTSRSWQLMAKGPAPHYGHRWDGGPACAVTRRCRSLIHGRRLSAGPLGSQNFGGLLPKIQGTSE
jgi:hypothetical protein